MVPGKQYFLRLYRKFRNNKRVPLFCLCCYFQTNNLLMLTNRYLHNAIYMKHALL